MKSGVARRLGRALASAAAMVLVVPASAQALSLAPSVTLTGTYTLVHVDGESGDTDRDAYRPVLRVGNRAYDVALGSGMAFRSGDTVSFGGHLDGRTLQASHAHIQSFASDRVQTSGTTRVLVILAEWTGQDSMSPATVSSVFASDNTWFQQTSYGHLSLTTTVTPWVHVNAPAAGVCTSTSAAYQLQTDALAAAGASASSYDRVVVYFPKGDSSCSGIAGFAEVSGSRVWLPGYMDVRSSVHEQGHNYGLYHAHSAACTTPGTTTPTAAPDAAADNCTWSDYGDPFDAMGSSGYAGEYSASQKTTLGWLDAGRTATLPASGTVTLVPYEQQSTAVHAASYLASSTRTYWFEYRSATGPDASLPAGATGGVLVHINDANAATASKLAPSWATPQSFVLDQTPADAKVSTAVLPYGQSWTSPEAVTFTVGTATAGTVTVSASVPSSGGGTTGGTTGGGATGGTTGGGTPGAAAGGGTSSSPPIVTPAVSRLTAQLSSGRSSITVSQGGSVVVAGTALRADGSAAAGLGVSLQAAPRGTTAWHTVTTLPASAGAVSHFFVAQATSDYRWHVAPSATEAGSDSPVVTVVVRPYVLAAATHTQVKHGHTVGLDVRVPGHAGRVVQVQRWSHNAWHPYISVRLGTNQRRAVSVRLVVKGNYRFRFVIAADADHVAGVSKTLRVRAI